MILLYIILATLAEMLVAFVGIFFIFLGVNKLKKYVPHFISFAVGTLLAVVFLSILPEAVEASPAKEVFEYTLIGFLFFFLLSRILHWYHHQHDGNDIICDSENHPNGCITLKEHTKKYKKSSGYLVLMGDAAHNSIDGVIIALAFLADVQIGVATTVAVLFHELPQEIADFFILINAGFTRMRALVLNVIVSSTTLLTALLTYYFAADINDVIGLALGLVAGNFLYIAASDLIPELHEWHKGGGSTWKQFSLILLGVLIMYLIIAWMPE